MIDRTPGGVHPVMVKIDASSFAQDRGLKSRLRALARDMLDEQDRRQRYFPRVLFDELPWRILLTLYVSETGRLSSDFLWQSLLAQPAAGSRWIDYLASEDLVTRHVEPSDKSRSMVELSPKGIGLLDLYLEDRLRLDELRTEPGRMNSLLAKSRRSVGFIMLVTAALSAGFTYFLTALGAGATGLDGS
jgi:DNA-binding MarR family transcriptional regulator